MNCGNSSSENIDFWIYMDQTWCNNSFIQTSEEQGLTALYETFTGPLLLIECNGFVARSSGFGWIAALYGSLMAPIWSGGILANWLDMSTKDGSTGTPDFLSVRLDNADRL